MCNYDNGDAHFSSDLSYVALAKMNPNNCPTIIDHLGKREYNLLVIAKITGN